MTNIMRVSVLAAVFAVLAMASYARQAPPTYILNGYSLSGIPGVNTSELQAKLKHKPGDHYTDADVNADQAIIAKELHARHITGQLVATIAEKHGRVWIIFDLLNTPPGYLPPRTRYLEAQNFEGASHVSPVDLAAATGLKNGEVLSPKKLNAARQAIKAMYAKAMPGKVVSLKGKMQMRSDGKVTLTWIVAEPK